MVYNKPHMMKIIITHIIISYIHKAHSKGRLQMSKPKNWRLGTAGDKLQAQHQSTIKSKCSVSLSLAMQCFLGISLHPKCILWYLYCYNTCCLLKLQKVHVFYLSYLFCLDMIPPIKRLKVATPVKNKWNSISQVCRSPLCSDVNSTNHKFLTEHKSTHFLE